MLPSILQPSPGSSGTYMSSKTPGRDLEDRWSLDRVPEVGSWYNFHRSFQWMLPHVWHYLQVHQKSPCPPRLQKETKRTGGVLTGFLKLNLDVTFTEASYGCSLLSDTISRFIRNLHVLEGSWSLDGFPDGQYWCKFHRRFLRMLPPIWHHL